jgi:hypothetical protein
MNGIEAAVVLATDQHLMEVVVATKGQRLLEVLNDPNSDFLRVFDLKLIAGEGDDREASAPSGIVRRSNIILALLSDQHEAPQRRQYSFVEKKVRSASMIAGGYRIQGELQIRGSDDPVAVVNAELQNFFPVTAAVVTHPTIRWSTLQSSVALVNKQRLGALSIGPPTDLCDPTIGDNEGSRESTPSPSASNY